MKKIYVFVMVMLVLLLTGCASKEDKAIAQNVISDIENIGTVSLDVSVKPLALTKGWFYVIL